MKEELNILMDEYYNKFKTNYPLEEANELMEETIAWIKNV